ncbi:UNVERIFIED_CONTAM: hypothetical protein Scaly_0879000 [Sesamum calycinum]|uniref:Glycoside hydrolase family 31 N-terminal domain-containing protein n=1 Tax=Sesamum calycinum TaxID=2727403 RepID=A0AAW2QWK3_9LAMI
MAGYEGTETRSGKMIFEPILEEGVFRFDCSADDRNAAFPSISFENPKVRDTPLVNVNNFPTYIPSFECVLGQQIVTIEFPPNTSFYGTGEVSGLERTGKRIFTWNTDAWGYGAGTTSLYQSHPWVLAVLPNGEALGVLADTTRRCEIDLRKEANVKLISSSPYPVITFGPFASPVDVLASFSRAVENAKPIPDLDNVPGHKGTELSRTPVEVKSGDWALKVVPWIGGRIISMEHLPSEKEKQQWRIEHLGYDLPENGGLALMARAHLEVAGGGIANRAAEGWRREKRRCDGGGA